MTGSWWRILTGSGWRLAVLAAFALRPAAPQTLPVLLGLDAYVPAPESNPLKPERVEVGKALFHFRGLSADRSLSCAGCHQPERAFTDGRSQATGVRGQVIGRRTPPLINRAWGKSFFWDGRAASLEDQVLQPVLNPKEMGLSLEEITRRVREDEVLRAQMQSAFGREVTLEDIQLALASYVRSILSGDSPYDRFVAGDVSALDEQQKWGLKLFRGKANCVACHVGVNFTDERFHNTGTGWRDGRWLDQGRAGITGRAEDRGAFKTPGLREVARTAPYMHDGSLKTLEEVIDFYDQGGRENPNLDTEIRKLGLTLEEKRALVAFLHSLSGKVREGWPGAP
ncbi:MAG: cytochrome-c peroxidase [Bryobacteraceae bacterium]|nr:cytochrome-c peroxidase [Bryobacteraceae bacterium]MDW8379163.1 cytochrome c peroxidase [Bryobacterales bacterium]